MFSSLNAFVQLLLLCQSENRFLQTHEKRKSAIKGTEIPLWVGRGQKGFLHRSGPGALRIMFEVNRGLP